MPVLRVFFVAQVDELSPVPKMLGFHAQGPQVVHVRRGDLLLQSTQVIPELARHPQVGRLQHQDDQDHVRNNQFIENPVLFNLA